jgi:hypothetical protein
MIERELVDAALRAFDAQNSKTGLARIVHYCSPNLHNSEFADYGSSFRTRQSAVVALNGSADLPYAKVNSKGSFENSDEFVFCIDCWFPLNGGATPNPAARCHLRCRRPSKTSHDARTTG